MGGKTFKAYDPPLDTPRMPPEIYSLALAQVLNTLRAFYTQVDTPLEAPQKPDHGDIDIILRGPFDFAFDLMHNPEAATSVYKALDAVGHLHEKNNENHFFAIKWPGATDKYIQVDIQQISTAAQYQWALFQTAHGDMCTILGSMGRPLGLVINGKGLHLKIPELEQAGVAKTQRMILLSQDPAVVLDFFGLDKDRYWERFVEVDDMLRYAATSRFFWYKLIKSRSSSPVETAAASIEGVEADNGERGSDNTKKDEKKMTQRNIFARWKEDFIPYCAVSGTHPRSVFTLDSTRKEVFATFPGVKQEYESRVEEWKVADRQLQLKKVIRECVPLDGIEPSLRAAAIHAFEDIILEGKRYHGIQVSDNIKANADGVWDIEVLRAWITADWAEVGRVAFKMQDDRNGPIWGKKKKKKIPQKAEEGLESERARVDGVA